jgi:putative NADH-flavin reductase
MQITIIGASGNVGRQVVALALERGYMVVAGVHRHNPFEQQHNLTIKSVDINDPKTVAEAIRGSQAVISTLGSWHTKSEDTVSRGTETLVAAAAQENVKRIITVTGAGALYSKDTPSLFDKLGHTFLSLVARKILHDGEAHLKLLEQSQLDWTCIRSPVMTKSPKIAYRLTDKLPAPWATIPRKAVAACLLDEVENISNVRRAPVITKAS